MYLGIGDILLTMTLTCRVCLGYGPKDSESTSVQLALCRRLILLCTYHRTQTYYDSRMFAVYRSVVYF